MAFIYNRHAGRWEHIRLLALLEKADQQLEKYPYLALEHVAVAMARAKERATLDTDWAYQLGLSKLVKDPGAIQRPDSE